MNYREFVDKILTISLSHRLVNQADEGDVYEIMNSGTQKYPSVIYTPSSITNADDLETVNGTLFFLDRELDDRTNKLEVQAGGINVLRQIFYKLRDENVDFQNITFTPFHEKFTDLCSGVYASFTVTYPNSFVCVDDEFVEEEEEISDADYLTFISSGNSGISFSKVGSNTVNLSYSVNNDDWTSWDFNNINLNDGDKVRFKGINNAITTNFFYQNHFVMTGSLKGYGNIMSLIDGLKDGTKVIPSEFCFCGLFNDCTALGKAPALPATTLTRSCYQAMFYNCTNLTTAPLLPAEFGMYNCYTTMFWKCSKLNYIKCMLRISSYLMEDTTNMWTTDVASSGTFVRPASASSLWLSGNSGIPVGWDVEDA